MQIVELVLDLAQSLIEYERIATSVIVLSAIASRRRISLSLRFPLRVTAGLLHIGLNAMFLLRTGLPGVPFWLIVVSATALFGMWLAKTREDN